jgi:hypothetical protein
VGDGDSFWVGTNKLVIDFDDDGVKLVVFN